LLRHRGKTAKQAGKPSAKEIAGSDVTAPIASAPLAARESRDDRNRLLPISTTRFSIVPQQAVEGRTVHFTGAEPSVPNGMALVSGLKRIFRMV
jgi:hypothetical protein